VAARSKAGICGFSLAGITGSNPAGAWMFASCERYVLSGRVLCVGPITRLGECGVFECDREASIMRGPCPTRVYSAIQNAV
jgi:coenzyme F420-reducing hydrogenase gamma subunit